MPWKWGKISDLDLEMEVKRCYRSLLEAQETNDNCVRAHENVGRAMEDKTDKENPFPGKWRFLKPRDIYQASELMEEKYYHKELPKSENPICFTSPYRNARFAKFSRPQTVPSYDKVDSSCNKITETNGDVDGDTSYSLPPVKLEDDKSFVSNISTIPDISLTGQLLRPDDDVNHSDVTGKTGLHYASKRGQITAVQQLLQDGAMVNAVDESGKSPLIYAVENGFTAVAKDLIDHGAYVNQKDNNRMTPLRLATEAGKKYLVSVLLKNRASVYILDKDMKAALHYAVEKNYPDIVELLIDSGAPVNQSDGNQRKSLHYAAERGYLSIVELLLKKGASIDSMDRDMLTPVFLAVEKGLEIMSHVLISKGASVNAADRRRRTPLHVAAGSGFINIAMELIANHAGVNNRDDVGRTPVFYAVQNGDVNMVNAFIQNGVQMDTSDIAGKTLLRYAIETQSEAMIYLVSKAELDQCGPKRHVYHRQLLTAIETECEFLGKTVWNHVIDNCLCLSSDVVECRLMTATVNILLDATCTAFSRANRTVLLRTETQLRNNKPENPYIVAHVIALPPARRPTFMGLPVVYKVSEFKAAPLSSLFSNPK
ncbi:ankyrin repeat domain-containing protein 50-like [Ostrea edulis]|uniref:ankyrin repeat domain-containing protein 50-like n=1 Tax=Ostrea edulis TaxID=37623 RepID=UPI0024AEC2A2|nr:ankyrin repeat domain-containing protein 50-like [Ostrea edulis]XP_048732300.2 ankyrin repeat domain-containing protein 50-like [Ostrea edulis]